MVYSINKSICLLFRLSHKGYHEHIHNCPFQTIDLIKITIREILCVCPRHIQNDHLIFELGVIHIKSYSDRILGV